MLLKEHSAGLKRLLSEKTMAEVWSPAVRYVARALRERGCASDSPDAGSTATLLNEAQDACERSEDGLCRYLLRRAALAARGEDLPGGSDG